MTKLKNRCTNCGGKLGLVSHQHWRLRFCRKACRDDFLAKTAKGYARLRKWLGWDGPKCVSVKGAVVSRADRLTGSHEQIFGSINKQGDEYTP